MQDHLETWWKQALAIDLVHLRCLLLLCIIICLPFKLSLKQSWLKAYHVSPFWLQIAHDKLIFKIHNFLTAVGILQQIMQCNILVIATSNWQKFISRCCFPVFMSTFILFSISWLSRQDNFWTKTYR